ncbi:MAG: hypothetical protein WC586_06575 [Methanoregula sp.]
MLKISEEDYRSLELKLEADVRKLFRQFLEDLKQKNSEPETIPVEEQQKPLQPCPGLPVDTTPASVQPKRPRMSKKAIEVSRMLHSSNRPGTNPQKKILEEDMNKIFRKKRRGRNG